MDQSPAPPHHELELLTEAQLSALHGSTPHLESQLRSLDNYPDTGGRAQSLNAQQEK
jgi:hypothetical protein